MAPVSYAQDLAVLLERGDITQMSFAFEVVKDQWETVDEEAGVELRTLLEVKLWDVSVVTYPAYEETDAGLRGAAFDVLSEMAGLDEDAQQRLLRKVANGARDEEFSTLVRAAADGLRRYEIPSEPPDSTRNRSTEPDQPDEPTGPDRTDQIRRRFTARAERWVAELERNIA